jgi:hypothetical protein
MTKANKLVFGLMALFCIDTPAETYSCAAELGRLGGVGEVEQQVFSRKAIGLFEPKAALWGRRPKNR